MQTASASFFPPRAKRDVLDFVISDFPFPLAFTYARLHEEMDRQEPIAAAWQLRDAFECLLKFMACLALTDYQNANPEQAQMAKIAQVLLKPQGLSLGDWHTLLELALEPLAPFVRAGHLDESGRCLPGLFTLFYEHTSSLSRSPLNRAINGGHDSFVHWRNRVFGHGVFRRDRQYYAHETRRWLQTLNAFYSALRSVLDGWQLASPTPLGTMVSWQGADNVLPAFYHQHATAESSLPLTLTRVTGGNTQCVAFGPLLSVQTCVLCEQPAAFFFDRHRQEKNRHRTFCLEYWRGHSRERRDWPAMRPWTACVPPTFVWERISFDSEETRKRSQRALRAFKKDYLRPAYLIDAFWGIVRQEAQGYVHLVGSGGSGKTYFVRGLCLDQQSSPPGTFILPYHILPGTLADYRTFIVELAAKIREQLRFHTQEIQTHVSNHTALQRQFVEFIETLMRANRLDTFILVLDGLDELPECTPHTATIMDFLPPAEQLPRGCFILLTSRASLRPQMQAHIGRLQQRIGTAMVSSAHSDAVASRFTRLEIVPTAVEHQHFLRAYLSARLPPHYCTPQYIETIMTRCGGIFLYAFHLCSALKAGVFPDAGILPDGDRFYASYLDCLQQRVGDTLFLTVYLPTLLFLTAAQQPVTPEQLCRWGIPHDRLRHALFTFRHFLHIHRDFLWHDSLSESHNDNRYEIAHQEFIRFVNHDAYLSSRWRAVHADIARLALNAHTDRWHEIDPMEDTDLYDLRFLFSHLRMAGLTHEATALRRDKTYALACLTIGEKAYAKARYHIAKDLLHLATTLYRHHLVEEDDRDSEDAQALATALSGQGNTLGQLGQFSEAIACYDEAIPFYRRGVERGNAAACANGCVTTLVSKGNALAGLGQRLAAMRCYDEAIALCHGLVTMTPYPERADNLASALMSKGHALSKGGAEDLPHALAHYEEAIELCRHLVQSQTQTTCMSPYTKTLAAALVYQGMAFFHLQRFCGALTSYQEAAHLYQQLVEQEGLEEFRNDLAATLLNQGNTLHHSGHFPRALLCYDEVLVTYRELVEVRKRHELAHDLAAVLVSKAHTLNRLHKFAEALACCDEAVQRYRHAAETTRQIDVIHGLAAALLNKGNALGLLGRHADALTCYDEAIIIYQELVHNDGGRELVDELNRVLENQGKILKIIGKVEHLL